MIKIKKISFFIIKYFLAIFFAVVLILFIYSAFFYEKSIHNTQSSEQEIEKIEETADVQSEQINEEEELKEGDTSEKKEIEVPEIQMEIKDGLFVVVGNKPITKSDIVNEIKLILILNNLSYADEMKDELRDMAVKSTIKRNIKKIAVEEYDFLEYSNADFNSELTRLANKLNVDLETLKNICTSNGLDFEIVKDQVRVELLWNSLIFFKYKNRISVNLEEIDEQLRSNQNKKEFEEFLVSEIIFQLTQGETLEAKIDEIKNKIELDGFENAAMSLSISQSAENGGDLGWINENEISKKFRSKIVNTQTGNLSEPILLEEGVLIFKVRDRRKIENKLSLEELKDQLVVSEKNKILNMYAMSHYDSLRRSISVNFIND